MMSEEDTGKMWWHLCECRYTDIEQVVICEKTYCCNKDKCYDAMHIFFGFYKELLDTEGICEETKSEIVRKLKEIFEYTLKCADMYRTNREGEKGIIIGYCRSIDKQWSDIEILLRPYFHREE